MKNINVTLNGKIGTIFLPIFPTKEEFEFFKKENPLQLVEVSFPKGGISFVPLKDLNYESANNGYIPFKNGWD
ncbi:MAG: hypothetical protein ACOXZ1_02610 [Patescibacteria group bacterium]|jgi:hypothetical protein|nr:hypothetical protein [Patescibacteria group bacterium]